MNELRFKYRRTLEENKLLSRTDCILVIKNSKFYHAKIKGRRRRNKIGILRYQNGSIISNEGDK